MSLFKHLRDLSIGFEDDLRNASPQLFTARIGKSFEEDIANKMQDLSLFTSKLRLLQAKTIAMTTQPPPVLSEEATLSAYEDSVTWKVIEQQAVKAVTQSRDVRALLTTPDSKLDHALVERKSAIISKLKEYRMKEVQLSEVDAMLKKAEAQHHELQSRWELELEELRSLKQRDSEQDIAMEGPLYDQLRTLINKIEMMRWLISRLVTARVQGYDWMSDPDRRLKALKMAREPNTMESYTGM